MPSERDLFSPDLVFFDWEPDSAEDLFRLLGGVLRERGNVGEGWFDAIVEREREFPTGLRVPGCGFAIPHVDPRHIVRPYIAVVKPRRPVVFEAMAGLGDPVPAEIVFNLGVLRDGGQVRALQALMNIFADEESVAQIMAQTKPQDMVDAILGHFE